MKNMRERVDMQRRQKEEREEEILCREWRLVVLRGSRNWSEEDSDIIGTKGEGRGNGGNGGLVVEIGDREEGQEEEEKVANVEVEEGKKRKKCIDRVKKISTVLESRSGPVLGLDL